MPINFGKVSAPKPGKRPSDPLEIFRGLRVADKAINDLWLAQGDALRQWDQNRNSVDVAIVLNTGAGKTLVGLLAAQSLVNETNGHVVYACSSIQLVEQTAAKAAGYGLEATTYFKQNFNNLLYQQGLAPCITTYQALFNGKSKFFRENLAAIIFDDAHAAEHLIRDHFTLKVSRSSFPTLFVQLTQLFRSYFDRVGKGVGYSEMLGSGDTHASWFVPPFALNEQLSEVQKLLMSGGLSGNLDTMFAWEHLKNHVDLCACFISGADVSITPPVIPVDTLPYFRNQVRRLYLSATLPAGDAFYRTFGREVQLAITPTTAAGECERLILIPSLNKSCADREDVKIAKEVVATHKALILVPSDPAANQWGEIVSLQSTMDVTGQVEAFKAAKPPQKLLLVGRYDGVDLPGDTCRLMIIDGLPSGVGPLERYLWEDLGMARVLRSTIASRVIQSFGRIFRGMSDHGVVVVTGRKLVNWLLTPSNRKVVPEFLARQLELGIAISRDAASIKDFAGAAQQCLDRDPGWIKFYQDNMQVPQGSAGNAADDELKIAKAQVDFGHLLWARDYGKAAKTLEARLDEVFQVSPAAGAWSALWLGYSYELVGDLATARALYRRAHSGAKNIPPVELQASSSTQQYPEQVIEVARYLDCGPQGFPSILQRFDATTSALKAPGSTVPQIEEAVRALGEFLGMSSTRPDKEYGTGPDVLWTSQPLPALCMEIKSDKVSAQFYWKKDVSQVSDHIQWVKENTGSTEILPAFVGPTLPPAPDANPIPELVVIELTEFSTLADKLRGALSDIYKTALPLMLRQDVHENFTERGLNWPEPYARMKRRVVRSLK